MNAWQLTGGFGLDNLVQVTKDCAPPKGRDVKVRVKACSLNYRDLMVVKGLYNPHLRFPVIPLSDGAGEVVEIGPEVTQFKVGDRVCATFSQKWCHGHASDESMAHTLGSPLDGMLCHTRTLHEDGLIRFPDYLSYEQAATLPCAGVTAFNAMFLQSELKPNDTVLIEGTGGVSLFALQFAALFSVRSIVISSSDEKLHKVREIAKDAHCINYRQVEDWEGSVVKATDGLGVDAVIEVGGAKTLGKAIASVKKGGVVCVIGILSGTKDAVDLRPILMNNIRIQGLFVGAKTVFEAMNRVLVQKKIKPVIDKVFEFNEAKEAFNYLESGKHFGKICIKVS